jgi:ubiquitin carboxyl-terminal hydrolase 8
MGSACCGRLYEGKVYAENKGLICKRYSTWKKGQKTIRDLPNISKNYTNLPNKFKQGEDIKYKFGLAGIYNSGNTCFINAALQCISNVQPLTEYFLAGIHEDEFNKKFNSEISTAYGEFVRAQWLDEYEYIQPALLLELIWESAPQFVPGEQHDSQEFLSFFLDSLHEELNRTNVEGIPRLIENTGEKEELQAAKAWKEYLTYNSSVIVDLFQGQLKSTLKCLKCQYVSITFDAFMFLTLPIPDRKNCSLEDCLKEFTKEELLIKKNRWICHSCGHKSRASKKIDIWKFPPILIINLKRFEFSRSKECKIDGLVEFPINEFDFSRNDIGPQRSKPLYRLFAKIDHVGSSNFGHYSAKAKNWQDQNWYEFDDETVRKVSEASLVSNSAYVLFYHNDSLEFFPTQSSQFPHLWPHCISSQVSRKNSNSFFESQALNSTGLSSS